MLSRYCFIWCSSFDVTAGAVGSPGWGSGSVERPRWSLPRRFGRLVDRDHHAGGRRPGVDEPESGERTAVGEETAPRSRHQRLCPLKLLPVGWGFLTLYTND